MLLFIYFSLALFNFWELCQIADYILGLELAVIISLLPETSVAEYIFLVCHFRETSNTSSFANLS